MTHGVEGKTILSLSSAGLSMGKLRPKGSVTVVTRVISSVAVSRGVRRYGRS